MNVILNSAQIRGFFEGDGGFLIRIDPTKKGFSFRSQAKFGQTTKNDQILKWCRESLDPTIVITSYKETDSSSLVFPFNSIAGEKIVKMYLENKPFNPGTLNDFLIAKKIHEYQTTKLISYSSVSDEVLQNQTEDKRYRLVILSLLWLRFQRAGTRLADNTYTIKYYQDMINASSDEISEAERLGNELLAPISMEVEKLISDLQNDKINICEDYLAYYHVADGSFSFEFGKRKRANGKLSLRIIPRWSIADDLVAKPLLERIVRQYNFSNYQYLTGQNGGYARANGWEKAEQVVIPFFSGRMLPDVIKNKVQTFINVCELHSNKNTYKNARLFRSYVEQAYFLNPSPRRTKKKFEKDYKSLIDELILEYEMTDSSDEN